MNTMLPNQTGGVGLIDAQILLMILYGVGQRLDGFLPRINGIMIAIGTPSLRIVENGVIGVEKLECHVIVVVVPLMSQETSGTILAQNGMNLFTLIEHDAPSTIQRQGG